MPKTEDTNRPILFIDRVSKEAVIYDPHPHGKIELVVFRSRRTSMGKRFES